MDLNTYKLLHILGLFLLFSGLGGILIASYSGAQLKAKAKMMAMMSHGLGLILILVSGFGMLARLGLTSGMPSWVYIKIGVWLILGFITVFMKKKPALAWAWWLTILGLGFLAGYMGLFHP